MYCLTDTPYEFGAKYPSISPYVRVANNPFRFVDRDGEKVTNPHKQVLGNTEMAKALERMNNNVMKETGLDDNEFNIVITGGDRMKMVNMLKFLLGK